MFQQPTDFYDECAALHGVIEPLGAADYDRATQFKDWTVNDILTHLHFWNRAAELSFTDQDKFSALFAEVRQAMKDHALRALENDWAEGVRGPDLLAAWRDFAGQMAVRWTAEDPSRRAQWAGPEMSIRSLITSRQMETWAHGQAIFDLLGVERRDTDRIRNIAHMGVSTYGWTFANRGEKPPGPPPHVRLTAPSGAVWEWNEADAGDQVAGSATEFCQVVTQTRNVADTALVTTGEPARRWMAIAQCFAGPPETPPAPGTRTVQRA